MMHARAFSPQKILIKIQFQLPLSWTRTINNQARECVPCGARCAHRWKDLAGVAMIQQACVYVYQRWITCTDHPLNLNARGVQLLGKLVHGPVGVLIGLGVNVRLGTWKFNYTRVKGLLSRLNMYACRDGRTRLASRPSGRKPVSKGLYDKPDPFIFTFTPLTPPSKKKLKCRSIFHLTFPDWSYGGG